MKTARGIYLNLEESDYTATCGIFTFSFSSRVYRRKFLERVKAEVCRFNTSINNIYKNRYDIDMGELAIIRLYQSIETRGFYIRIHEEVVTCPENLKYVLHVQTNKLYGKSTGK